MLYLLPSTCLFLAYGTFKFFSSLSPFQDTQCQQASWREKRGGGDIFRYKLLSFYPENFRRAFFYLFRNFSGVSENEQTDPRKTDKEQPDLTRFV